MASFLADNGGEEESELHLVPLCRMPEQLIHSDFWRKVSKSGTFLVPKLTSWDSYAYALFCCLNKIRKERIKRSFYPGTT